jgi:hypothetical protein
MRQGRAPMQTHKRTATRTIEPQDFLLPDPAQRRRPSAPVRAAQIEDAVFEVVPVRPRPRSNDNPPPRQPARETGLLPILARMGGHLAAALEKRLAGLSPQAFVTLLTSAVLAVFWLCGGFSALGASPADATEAPFSLVNTSIDTEDANGMKVAMVTGAVRNTSGRIIDAPRLAIVSGGQGDIIGTIVLPVDRIGPGVTIPFGSRFRLAGGKSSDLSIIPERL